MKRKIISRKQYLLIITSFMLKLFIAQALTAQSRVYHQLDIAPDSSAYATTEGYVFQSFSVHNSMFLFGSFSAFNPDTTAAGPRMVVKNAANEVLYASPGFSDSESLTPLFYKTESRTDPLLIFVGIGGFGNWGNALFQMVEKQVEHLGFLHVATYDSTDLPGNITPYTTISTRDSMLKIEFPDNTILLNPGSEGEKQINGAEIYYQYTDGKLELIRR